MLPLTWLALGTIKKILFLVLAVLLLSCSTPVKRAGYSMSDWQALTPLEQAEALNKHESQRRKLEGVFNETLELNNKLLRDTSADHF